MSDFFKTSILTSLLPVSFALGEVELPQLHQIDLPAATSAGPSHGAAVAMDGEWLVVGRPGDATHGDFSGAVDVYRQVATELTLEGLPWTWVHHCRLYSGHPEPDARFGASVDIDGSTVLVGSWKDPVSPIGSAMGSVWVFELPGTPQEILDPAAWLQPAALEDEDYFGWAVAISGDVAAVGGWGRDVDDDLQRTGAVWIFERDQAEWPQIAELNAGDDAETDARFGFALDMVDDVLLVGAPRQGDNQGAAFLFRSENGTWSLDQRVDSPEGDTGERFGTSVVAIRVHHDQGAESYGIGVGAPGDGELGPQAGAAWAFEVEGEDDLVITMEMKLTPYGGSPFDAAGTSLAVISNDEGSGGDTNLLMGAPGWTDGSGQATGTVFVADIDEDQEDGDEGPVNLGQGLGAQSGASVASSLHVLPPWNIRVFNIAVGGPGVGEVRVVSILPDHDSDCNSDGRFDLAEVILLGAVADCDGDGNHDACQLEDPAVDCDGNDRLDTCDLMDDPSRDCDGNGRLDDCDLNEGGKDCDGNGVLDMCDLAGNPGSDCNANGILDTCELDQGADDCDGNGRLDSCDLADNPGLDCDGNGLLDSCELAGGAMDCDANGVLDTCDLAQGALDCDENGVPDVCDLTDPAVDCDGNGRLDTCDLMDDPSRDCDGNGRLDDCDLNEGGKDCDGNGVLDMCEAGDPALDCDGNGAIDSCEMAADPSLDCDDDGQLDVCQGLDSENDCDGDGTIDACQIAGDPAVDCDGDGVIDLCQLAQDPGLDCNVNGLIDLCEIIADPRNDCDGDGVHDDCDASLEIGDPLWVTQRNEGFFPLAHFGARLVPTGNPEPPFYDICTAAENDLWISSAGHAALALGDDDSVSVPLPWSFDYAGNLWQDIFVGSNGNLTFGTGDITYTESLYAHFALPRISALFDDLDPSAGGEVRVGAGPAGSFVVTWYQVPNYGVPSSLNSAQAILHPDGVIELVWSFCDSTSSVTGLSMGSGRPPYFLPTDLGGAWDCVARVPASWGDCNENGTPDFCEPVPLPPPHWGVEHWFGDVDIQHMLVRWQPNGGGAPPIHDVCSTPIAQLPFDPTQGVVLSMADDGSIPWTLPFTFPFAGYDWNGVFISSNGYVTFGTADFTYEVSTENHFALARISALFCDLDPSEGGLITVQTGPAGSEVISWLDVPIYNAPHGETATVQMLLHPDGAFEVAYGDVSTPLAMAGPSDGLGIPWNFGQTDLSEAWDCQLRHPFDDCNLNGVDDAIEKWLGCAVDDNGDAIPDECQGAPQPYVPACVADIDGSGDVTVLDLLRLLESWGDLKHGDPGDACDIAPPGKRDGRVDVDDLLMLVQSLGDPC